MPDAQAVTPRRGPAARGVPLLGVLPRMIAAGPELCVRVMHEDRGVVPLRMGPSTTWLVTHPDHMRHVLVDNARNYWKGPAMNRIGILYGRSLLLTEGDEWLRRRRLMQPAFHHARLAGLVPLMAQVVAERLARWEAAARGGSPLDLVPEMRATTLAVLCRTLFSLSVGEAEIELVARVLHVYREHFAIRVPTHFLPEWVPLPGAGAARRAGRELDALVYGIIAERRRAGGGPGDLLDVLMSARDEETGEAMGDRELRDEVVNVVDGGYEATADALSWAWHLLGEHPDAGRRVRDEVRAAVSGEVPTVEELGRLDYTGRVVQEAMRLYPPFWHQLRSAREDDVIGGRRVPAGAPLMLAQYATHRHPDFWEDPERFDPDRFLPERAAGRHRFAYMPFSAGQRQCIGNHMAMLEMKLVVAMAVRAYRLSPVPERPVVPGGYAALRPQTGVWMRVEPA